VIGNVDQYQRVQFHFTPTVASGRNDRGRHGGKRILRGFIDQFSNLDGIAGRILGCYEHGPTFFVREILDGIVAKPGGDYIHGGYRHRQALQQSRVKYHGLPGPPLVRADHES
tara:strand:- start:140 stop:478 length:339 start_codon:yes stop_codon:yes gene_type:complete